MFKSVVDFNGQSRNISFFSDDTINVVRQQIAKTVDIHQDRLFISLVLKLDKDYYSGDSRNWEALFNRISMNGLPIERDPFYAYCDSRDVKITYKKLDKEEWMAYPAFLQPLFDPGLSFDEPRIFGVEPDRAYTLPMKFDTAIANLIPTAQYPIPEEGRLFVSMYPNLKDTDSRFVVKEYETGAEGAYFPLMRLSTPQRLTEGQILALDAQTKHLNDLLSLDPPHEKEVHILKATWNADLVDTDFGKAVSTRFEQIFYGLTVSEEIPCVTFFTGRSEISRHKFYKKDAKTKTTFLKLPIWAAWWTKSKPYRPNLSALVLYRGEDREIFDRITITSHDIKLAVYRDASNKESLDDMKESMIKWLMSFDAVVPFLQKTDITDSRFVLQDIKFEAEYSTPLDTYDTLRMNCLAGIFEVSRKSQQVFKFLRSDDADDGINPRDVRIINLIREDPFIKPSEIQEELKLSLDEATILLNAIKQRVEQDPNLLIRQFRSFPGLIMHQKKIEISDVDSIDRFLKYANILRYILSDPTNEDVSRICPKRQESVPVAVSTVNTQFVDTEFSNLFDYLEGDVLEEAKPEMITVQKTNTAKGATIYNYFNTRLQEFNPVKFPSQSDYAKRVDQNLQPVIMSSEEIQDIIDDVTKGEEFNPRKYPDNQKIELTDPDGIILCPDFWCMYDKIPLHMSQLEEIDGNKVCPVCHGKVRKPSDYKADTREFSVIPRTKGNSYPGYKNNNESLPICFKSPKERKLKKDDKDDKYYILSENKSTGYGRFAYLPKDLLNSIHISEEYKLAIEAGNRIQTGMSGFFRVGLGRPSDGLPNFLNITTKVVSPRHAIANILRCAFVATWSMTSETHAAEIEKKLDMIPFADDAVARKHMARVISSIDEAFIEGRLTVVQELEYTAIMLNVDFYRISLEDITVGCTFYIPQVKVRTRGVIILQRGNDVDCLCFVTRQQKKFIFKANIFEPPFKDETYVELTKKRNLACVTNIPTMKDAFLFAKSLVDEFFIVLDPFGRAQALYIPHDMILPFQNTTIPPLEKRPKISGYSDVHDLPTYEDMRTLLKKAQEIAPGYEWAEDMYDGHGHIVEILTRSGLRIPVLPKAGEGEASEVTQTIIRETETSLALGEPNAENFARYKQISYASELYEFLLYQLTLDIKNKIKPELNRALSEPTPKRSDLEPELEEWFEQTTHFVSLNTPIEFLSKIRKPCGQFKEKECPNAHMCAWDGKTCRIQVRDTISKTKLFNKLLGTLIDNSKIRSIILDGRTTPFFSTVLYLELPTEVIYTDTELKETIYAQ
uniref:Uncharacterized protein n=1 Tax=viral metagenome TaxID=1070528 RepID=A0A6C0F923_9ZZZZ